MLVYFYHLFMKFNHHVLKGPWHPKPLNHLCMVVEPSIEQRHSGSLGGAAVWHLPLAQGAILETWDRIPRRAPSMEPVSPSACVSASLSLPVSLMNIQIKYF